MEDPGLKVALSVPRRSPRISVLVAGGETVGRCGLVEMVEESGKKLPRHLHHREDETLYVIEGSLSVWAANRWIEVPAGAALFLPRGVEHAVAAATEGTKALSFFAPAGFEEFYQEMEAAGPLDVERLVTMAARYGCEITGPIPERPRVESDNAVG